MSSPLLNCSQKSWFADGVRSGVAQTVPTGQKDPLWYGLGFRLSALRSKAGLPATAVGLMSQIGQSTPAAIEDGINCPKLDTVERLSNFFDISPSWLAFGDEGLEPFRQRRPRELLAPESPVPNPAERATTDRYRDVGRRCLSVRRWRGQSLRVVAGAAGISHESLNLIEKGTSIPLVSTVERLAVALDVAPAWLAFGEGQQPDGLDS